MTHESLGRSPPFARFEQAEAEQLHIKRRQKWLFGLAFVLACLLSAYVGEMDIPEFVDGLPAFFNYFRDTLPEIGLTTFSQDVAEWYRGWGKWLKGLCMTGANIPSPVSSELITQQGLSPSWFQRIIHFSALISFLGFTLYSLYELDFFNLPMIWQGLTKLFDTLQFMLPPAAHGRTMDFIWAVLETLAMAFLGTLLATIASLVFGFLGAKNVIAQPLFHFCIRRVMVFCGEWML